MRTCRSFRQDILRAVDGDLPVGEVLRMDAHLARCVECRSYQLEHLQLNDWVALMPEPALERLDVQAAGRAVQTRMKQQDAQLGSDEPKGSQRLPSMERARSQRVRLGLVLAAAALLLAVGGWRWSQTNELLDAGPPEALATHEEHATHAVGLSLEPQLLESEVEPLGRESVEATLRETLLLAFDTPGGMLLPSAALAVFDQNMGSSFARWPLAPMAERLLRDDEEPLAAAAARYLGLRGGRLSVASLRAGLSRPGVAPQCVLALGDMGPLGVQALGEALKSDELLASALDQLVRIHSAEAAEAIGQALLKRLDEPALVAHHLNALGALGAAAMPILLDLAERSDVGVIQVVEAMGLIDGAGAELARLVGSRRGRYDVGLIFGVMDQLQVVALLPWLEERIGAFEHRTRALKSLAKLPGIAPLGVLLDLAQRGALGESELNQAVGDLSHADGARMQAFAERLLLSDDLQAAGQYLSLLINSAAPGGAGALAVLAASDSLPADERQWAALAVGELGGAVEAAMLRDALAAGELSERRLMAACLITVFHSLGEEGVFEALGSYPLGAVNEVFEALVDASTDPNRSRGAVQLFRIARVLNRADLSRNPKLGQSSL